MLFQLRSPLSPLRPLRSLSVRTLSLCLRCPPRIQQRPVIDFRKLRAIVVLVVETCSSPTRSLLRRRGSLLMLLPYFAWSPPLHPNEQEEGTKDPYPSLSTDCCSALLVGQCVVYLEINYSLVCVRRLLNQARVLQVSSSKC